MRPAMDAPSNMKFWRAQLEYLIGIASGDGTFKVISYFDEGKGTRDQMKYMFASDIHGSAWYCRRLLEEYRRSGADRLILLGDILYHGPRNDLPKEYAPKEVIAMLNAIKSEIIAVRGNCEAEVDQDILRAGQLRSGSGPDGAGISGYGRLWIFGVKRSDILCNSWSCVPS